MSHPSTTHPSISPENECPPSSMARGEQALWTAVITQALMDAASRSHKREARKEKSLALSWLADGALDFQDVCDLAGLDPDYVARHAKHALARDCQWRLPAGEGWRSRARRKAHATTQPAEVA